MTAQAAKLNDNVDREHVAYHEAGHAVVCLLLGHEVRDVTIKTDKQAEGRTRIYMHMPEWGATEDDIRIELAGAIAEALVNPTSFEDKIKLSAQGDMQRIRKFALEIALETLAFNGKSVLVGDLMVEADGIIGKVMEETEALVEGNKQAIIRVAEALLEHGTLTGDEVKQFIESYEDNQVRRTG
jgi:ATP-dependent Zn protease